MIGESAQFSNIEIVRPNRPCGTGVVVLGGSSGAIERDRAALLARQGAVALAMRWFGGPGQQPGPWEVPLETILDALDWIAPDVDRLALMGSSFGAEAALCVATLDHRISAVVAIAPSAYVWPGVDPNGRITSHWTWKDSSLNFIPLDDAWTAETEPPAYRSWYAASVEAFPDHARAAAIPVEDIRGELLLIAGEDDQVWPSADWARSIATRRSQHGLDTTVATHPEAGHRVVFPGEQPVSRGQVMQRGGTGEANTVLGTAAWPSVLDMLRLHRQADG